MKPIRTVLILATTAASLAACSKPQTEESSTTGNETATAETPAPAMPVAYADLKGNAAAGEAAFAQCRACHSLEEDKHLIGPSLHKIIGQKAGDIPAYNFSPAMKASGITWSEDKIFEFIENPRKMVPGTKMSFAGIPDAQKRADLIAWLKANGGS